MNESEYEDVHIKIIIKRAEVSNYWQNYVKSHRATKAYGDIENAVDNFLRGYNEAIQDVIDILDASDKGETQ